jgi:tyrosyl-tRNA synthetase
MSMTKYKSEFLNILDERGFIHQCSDFAALDKKLSEGVQSAYIGFDATAPSLHAGSLVQIMMLHWFQKSGHKPITLMGGGTTKVGDPSGKDESRKLLDDVAIQKNLDGIKQVFSKYLSYGSGKTDAVMVNNDDWLAKLNYIEFLRDYGPHFTINRMMTFDSVKLRLEREQPLTFLEFNYMILQAYDFVELFRRNKTILQMGGSDQWGNIINGVELGRRTAQAELFALTTPLLTTSSGAKMGKTAEGAVWLNADMLSPYNYYQYWRNTEDADVGKFLRLFTTLPIAEIKKLEALKDKEINEAKKVLAFEATKLCHGEKAAEEAQGTAQKVFEQGGVGGDLPSISLPAARFAQAIPVVDLFVEAKLAASKSEARRLIQQGGASVNDNKVENTDQTVSESDFTKDGYIKLSAGKKKHALVKKA